MNDDATTQNVETTFSYKLGTVYDLHGGVVLLVNIPSKAFLVLALDAKQIEEFRKHLSDAEELLKGKSGHA